MNGKIYKATSPENISYIGMTTQTLHKRMIQHKSNAKLNFGGHFYNAIRKYGFENFKWEIIREGFNTKEILEAAEIFYISLYNTYYNGYNDSRGGESNIGYIYGEKHSKAVSEALNKIEENGLSVAQNASNRTEQYDRSGENNPFYGKTHSEESKKKIAKNSEKLTGLKKTKEHCKNISKAMIGKQYTKGKTWKCKELTCPHCNLTGRGGNMTRYHFDNCKKLSKDSI